MSVVSGYDYYRTMTVDKDKVDAVLANYPVKAYLDIGNFDFSKVESDGGLDVVFSDDDDNLLDFERVYYENPSAEAIELDSTQEVDIAGGLSFGSGDDLELEFDVYITGYIGTNPGVWRSDSDSKGDYFFIIDDGRPWVRWATTDILKPTAGYHLPLNEWVTIKLKVTSAGVAEFYVDDVLKHSDTHSKTTGSFTIYNYGWQYAIDEKVMGYQRNISFKKNSVEVLKWLCDEGSGTTLDDSVGTYDGTLATDLWLSQTKQAEFHIKVPSVSATVDTPFKMHYGKVDATDQANASGTWDSNFVGVWHMATYLDSTGNDNDLTASNAPTTAAGLNGKAYSFDGSDDALIRGSMSFAYPLTLQHVGYIDQAISADQNTVQITDASAPQDMLGVNFYDSGSFLRQFHYDATFVTLNTKSAVSTEHVLSSAVFVNNAFDLYMNGASPVQNTGDYPLPDNLDRFSIGALKDSSPGYHRGLISEVRLSNIARSAAWIKADDYNLRLNTLLTVGTEQGGGSPPPVGTLRRFAQLI